MVLFLSFLLFHNIDTKIFTNVTLACEAGPVQQARHKNVLFSKRPNIPWMQNINVLKFY